jgi:hypothetical protein
MTVVFSVYCGGRGFMSMVPVLLLGYLLPR